jgi:hypothetical protein
MVNWSWKYEGYAKNPLQGARYQKHGILLIAIFTFIICCIIKHIGMHSVLCTVDIPPMLISEYLASLSHEMAYEWSHQIMLDC